MRAKREPMNLTELERETGVTRQDIAALLRYEKVPVVKKGRQTIVMPEELPRVFRMLKRLERPALTESA